MITKRLLAAPILAALLLSDGALACPPPPPQPMPPTQMEGESGDDFVKRYNAFQAEQAQKKAIGEADWAGYRRGYESAVSNAADVIALVEVINVETSKLKNSQGRVYGNSPQPTFKVLAFADKSKPGHKFTMEYTGMTSCGPLGNVSMVRGKLGDRFLVFGKKGRLGMKTVIAGYKEDDLLASYNKSMFTLLTRRVASARSEFDRLAQFLDRNISLKAFDRADRDLNGDGVDEQIILATSHSHCGSGGCTMLVLQSDDEGFRLVSETTVVNRPVRLLDSTTNGWRDLEVRSRFDASKSQRATLKYDGKSYPANPSVPPAELSEDSRSGSVIFE